MKKSLFKFCTGAILSGLLLFTACENFSSGSNVVNDINSKIDYEKSTRFSVTVAPSNTQHGAVTSTTNIANCRVTDAIKIEFSSFPDYCFTHWEVVVAGKVDTKGEYVTIANLRSNSTTAVFKKVPLGGMLQIVPVCELRPRITSIKPDTDDEFRDSPIKVRFTQRMNENSIYFSDTELNQIPGITEIRQEKGKKYGYVKNGVLYFKNITIINERTGASILDYYQMPYFESGKTLIIPTKKGVEAPRAGWEITVEISNNMFYTANGYDIPLLSSQNGFYGTNSSTDNEAPSLEIYAPKLQEDAAWGYTPKAGSVRAYGAMLGFDPSRDSSKITTIEPYTGSYASQQFDKEYFTAETKNAALASYVRDRIIYVKAQTIDTGSRPEMIGMVLERLDSYISTGKVYEDAVKLPMIASGTTGTVSSGEVADFTSDYAAAIDFTDKTLYPDGIYKALFFARDKNGNISYDVTDVSKKENPAYGKFYYFIFDGESPVISQPQFSVPTTTEIKPQWGNPTAANITKDYRGVVVQYKNATDEEYGSPLSGITSATTTRTIDGLTAGTFYDVKIFASDWYGNSSNAYVFRESTLPNPVNLNLVTGQAYSGTTLTLTWDKPEGNYSGTRFYYNTQNSNSTSKGAQTFYTRATDETLQTATISDLTAGTTYYIFAYPYINYNNNYTSCSPRNEAYSQDRVIDINPNAVTNFAVAVNSSSKVTLSWTKPTGLYDGFRVYKKESSADTYTRVDSGDGSISISASNYVIDSGLVSGTTYDFKVVTYKALQSERTADSAVITRTITPSPVTNLTIDQVSGYEQEKLKLFWSKPQGLISGYNIYRTSGTSTTFSSTPHATVTNVSATNYTDASLSHGVNYTYKVVPYVTVGGIDIEAENNPTTSLYTRPDAVSVSLSRPVLNPDTAVTFRWPNYPKNTKGFLVLLNKVDDTLNSTNTTCIGYWYDGQTNRTYDYKSDRGIEAGTKHTFWVVSYANTTAYTAKTLAVAMETFVNKIKNGTAKNVNVEKFTYYTNPAPVTGLTATQYSTSATTLSWTKGAGTCSGYRIYHRDITTSTTTAFAVSTLAASITGASTTCRVTGLSAGKKYEFKVVPYTSTSFDPDGEHEGAATTVTSYAKPNAPTGVGAGRTSGSTKSSITVTWTLPTGNYDGLKVIYGTSSSPATVWSGTISKSSTSAKVTGLSANTKYYFKVVSYAGTWSSSTAANATASGVVDCTTAPNAVTNVTGTTDSTAAGKIKVSWTAPTGGCYGYALYYGTSSTSVTNYITRLEGDAIANSYTWTNATPGTKYYFKVVSYSMQWMSATSDNTAYAVSSTATWARPNYPTDWSVKGVKTSSSSKLTIDWTNPSTGTYSGIAYAVGTSTDITEAVYKGWEYRSAGTKEFDYTFTPGTTYYVWIGTWSESLSWAQIRDKTSGAGNVNPSYKTVYIPYTVSNVKVDLLGETFLIPNWTNHANINSSYKYVFKYRDLTAGETDYWKSESSSTPPFASSYVYPSSAVSGHKYEIMVGTKLNGHENYAAPVTAYTRPKAYTTFLTGSPTISTGSAAKSIKIAWSFNSSSKRNDANVIFFVGTSNIFSEAKYLDYWNGAHAATSQDYTAYSGTNFVSGKTYYVWAVLYAGPSDSRPKSPADIPSVSNSTDSSTKSTYSTGYLGTVKAK